MTNSTPTRNRRLFLHGWWIVLAAAATVQADPPAAPPDAPAATSAGASMWEGPKLTPVAREEVFAFSREPTFRKLDGDRYEISFAAKAACDVAVAIHDGSGRLVRHVAAGVLGPNAPTPLKPDSLDQTLAWDGKDAQGQYVREPGQCTARVSLGLKPTFDKLLNYYPKDTTRNGPIVGLAVDSQGAYVLEIQSSGRSQFRMYDHDANYVRTLWPFPADKFDALKSFIKTRKVEEDGRTVPQLTGIGALAPMDVEAPNCVVAVDGRLGLIAKGGYGSVRRLIRLRSDGATGGEPIDGPRFMDKPIGGWTFGGPVHAAIAPDGKTLYVGGLKFGGGKGANDIRNEHKPYRWNAIYRFGWDQAEPVVSHDAFMGEAASDNKAGADNDESHFNGPTGLAVDAAGRLYVCDTGNRRIQVFTPEARLVKSITGVADPQAIAVHQKTGEIYVLRYSTWMKSGTPLKLTKYSPLPECKPLLEADFPTPRRGYDERLDFTPLMALDSWTARPRVWLVHRRAVVCVYEERDGKFALIDDFEKDVIAAGLRPRMLGDYGLNKLAADPVRGHLYYLGGGLKRCDPETDVGLASIGAPPGGWQDLDVGVNGLLYLRYLKFIARFDPAKIHNEDGQLSLPYSAEVPFDYGEGQDIRFGRPLIGAIKIAAMPGANGFDTGFGVAPNGDIIAFMKNYRNMESMTAGIRANKWLDAWQSSDMNWAHDYQYRPRMFPGRHYGGGELIMKWSDRGEPIAEDLVPALPMASAGVHLDRDGNIYLGIGANMVMADGKAHSGGCVAKFGPTGGKFYGKGDFAKLDKPPDRPAEFCGVSGWGNLWTQGMFWAYPGYDQQVGLRGGQYPCLCASCRFDLDLHARSFVPKAYQFTVGVIDANGNRICEVGRYGNVDSPAMKPGDTNIGIAHCSYLATDSDKWLYLNDDGNNRIIRVKLGYHAEKRVGLAGGE